MMYHGKTKCIREEKRNLFCQDQYSLVEVVPHSLACFRYENTFFDNDLLRWNSFDSRELDALS